MGEPQTVAGKRLYAELLLDALPMDRVAALIVAIEAECASAALSAARARVKALPVHYRRNGFASATAWVTQRDVLFVMGGDH